MNNKTISKYLLNFLPKLLLTSCLLSSFVLALPEDASQEIIIAGGPGEFDLNLGLVVLRGTEDNPVVITQGTLKVTGLEVTLERVNGVIHKLTSRGKAHFEQQPEIDKGIMYADGDVIIFDNTAQYLTIDKNAVLQQDGNTLTGCHIDYDLNTTKGNITNEGCDESERLRMVIPPGESQ